MLPQPRLGSCLPSLAPLDIHDRRRPQVFHGLHALYEHFGIPTEFILERVQSVTHSTGSFVDEKDDYGVKFPLLS